MTLATYDANKHDIGVDGIGWVWARGESEAAPVALQRMDAEPSTARAAVGEGPTENFTLSSFFFQTDVEAGVGQLKLQAADRGLSSIADTRFQGHIFPPKGVLTTGSIGGGTNGYFRSGDLLYGILSTTTEAVAAGTAYGGSTPPRVGQRPKVSSTGAAFWVSNANTLLKQPQAAAVSNITSLLPNGVTPYAVDLYQRFLWCIGQRTLEASGTFVQHKAKSITTGKSHTLTFDTAPIGPGSVCVAIFHCGTTFGGDASPTFISATDGWVYQGQDNNAADDRGLVVFIGAGITNPTVNFTFGESLFGVATIMEFIGVDQERPILDVVFDRDTTNGFSSGSASAVTGINIFTGYDTSVGSTAATPTNYTEIGTLNIFYRTDTTDTSVTANATGETDSTNVLIKLRSNAITTDLPQTVFLFSSDDGASWTEAFNGDSAGMPLPISTLAVQGSMFITTAYGLYEFKSEDTASGGVVTVLNAIRGSMDDFYYPLDANAIGAHMAAFDGSVYYSIGATLRRYPPGGRAEQIWPPRGWSAGGGNIISMTSGEGGVYFGTSTGFLWVYDGRGFHQIAKATPTQLSHIFWHGGKLYLAGDPAPYFRYDYPGLRPDVTQPGPTTYTTGYFISSILNMEKIGDPKIVRRFETHAEFSAGATTAESGTLTIQYLNGDTGVHPDRYDPDSNTPTWVTVGTHSVEDGNVKEFTIGTPIEFKNLYIRIILTPGTVGIPICEGFGVEGEVLMQRRVRIPALLSISTDTLDRAGALMYPTEALVDEAIDKLMSLRDRDHASYTPYFNVVWRMTGGSSDTHLCICEKLDEWLESWQGANGAFSHSGVAVVFREIP